MSAQLLVFSCGPKGQVSIQLAHSRIERRAIISPVVEGPTSNDWIKHPGQIFDRLLIDPCRSLIRLHSLIRFPDLPFRNTERLCLTHQAPPIAGWLIESGSMTQPLRSIPLSGASLLLRVVPPLKLRFRTLALVVLPLVASPLASKSQVPTFRLTASLASSGHLSCRMPLRP